MELHLSPTLIPVIQKSTIYSCGVIGINVKIKKQVICLSVAANQNSQIYHNALFRYCVKHTVYLYTTAPDIRQKTVWIILKYSCDWMSQWNELISPRWPKKKKKTLLSVSANWLKHLKSLSKIRNKSSSITVFPMSGIYRHQKWRVKPATFLKWLKKIVINCSKVAQIRIYYLTVSLFNTFFLLLGNRPIKLA